MRRSLLFCSALLAMSLLLIILLQNGNQAASTARRQQLPAKQQLVGQLGLTDLSLWSEARYTRHPSQADLFSAFQDYPGAFDHFPAGSIIPPGQPQRETSLTIKKKGAR